MVSGVRSEDLRHCDDCGAEMNCERYALANHGGVEWRWFCSMCGAEIRGFPARIAESHYPIAWVWRGIRDGYIARHKFVPL